MRAPGLRGNGHGGGEGGLCPLRGGGGAGRRVRDGPCEGCWVLAVSPTGGSGEAVGGIP